MSFSLPVLATRGVAHLAEARAARAARAQLRAELESYRTPSERAELGAILSRHTPEELDTLASAAGRSYAA